MKSILNNNAHARTHDPTYVYRFRCCADTEKDDDDDVDSIGE